MRIKQTHPHGKYYKNKNVIIRMLGKSYNVCMFKVDYRSLIINVMTSLWTEYEAGLLSLAPQRLTNALDKENADSF